MNRDELRGQVNSVAERLAVPGAAVGVYHAGREDYVFHGVTSIENPLPVHEHTLFQFGSIGKTWTATAVMRLVDQGRVELEAPARRYLPELRLRDEQVAEQVTILHLLNHTAGWAGDLMVDTGEGDDALTRYVEAMAGLEQLTSPGSLFSYNNASLSLAGRVIERVTGDGYEQAMRQLLFEPLGLKHCFFFPNEIMTRRFVVGHHHAADGSIRVARPWALPRGGSPQGGISCNVGDQITWARFHLGDGRASDGTQLLDRELVRRMREPTIDIRGSAQGDHVGIAWFLRDVEGVRLVGHDGDTNGQYAKFLMVPERDWAIIVMANCGPSGLELNEEVARWALHAYLGIDDVDPEPAVLGDAELVQYVGEYESLGMLCRVTAADGGLVLAATNKPEIVEQMREAGDKPPDDLPPLPAGLLPGTGDRYIVTGGPLKGLKGYFGRDSDGAVTHLHAGGRLFTRTTQREPDTKSG